LKSYLAFMPASDGFHRSSVQKKSRSGSTAGTGGHRAATSDGRMTWQLWPDSGQAARRIGSSGILSPKAMLV
jgi:hypothetical protein